MVDVLPRWLDGPESLILTARVLTLRASASTASKTPPIPWTFFNFEGWIGRWRDVLDDGG